MDSANQVQILEKAVLLRVEALGEKYEFYSPLLSEMER